MVATTFHQKTATWATILGLAVTACGVVFTAGDANQRLTAHGTAIVGLGSRIDAIEAKREAHEALVDKRMTDLEVLLARVDQATEDTRQTAHRLENKKNAPPFY